MVGRGDQRLRIGARFRVVGRLDDRLRAFEPVELFVVIVVVPVLGGNLYE
jgi:hypothetical protein